MATSRSPWYSARGASSGFSSGASFGSALSDASDETDLSDETAEPMSRSALAGPTKYSAAPPARTVATSVAKTPSQARPARNVSLMQQPRPERPGADRYGAARLPS